MSGKTATVSQSQPAAGNLRIQTAVYGTAIQIVYGTARVAGNLAWFGNFRAIPHTTTTSSGGKGGGGVKTSTTDYTYVAAVLMVLCEGTLNNVLSAWRGKTRYYPQPAASVPVQRTETYPTPFGASSYQVQYGGSLFLNDVSVDDGQAEAYDNAQAFVIA